MEQLTQKEAVYNITMSVLYENKVVFDEGEQHINEVMTKEMRSTITECLMDSFRFGDEVKLDKDYDYKKLRAYTQGVISNWYRKDPRLNGGTKYIPKKKGSRVGLNDPQVKAMRKMLKEVKKTNNQQHINAIQTEINKRLAIIQSEKAKSKVDVSAIPEHLRHLV